MSRRRRAEARQVLPDPVYNSTLAEKFINNMMWDGKKTTAQRVFYDALEEISKRGVEGGGEPIEVLNASRHGPLQFSLPACGLEAAVKIAGAVETPPLNLETVLVEPDRLRLCLTWRAAQPCDTKALKIEEVAVALNDMTIDGRKVWAALS